MADSWQVSGDAARVYERELVPALFTEWPSHLLEAAAVVPSGILDVACGTGVVLRTALARKLFVVGTDLNPTMLQVAAELGVDAAFAQSTVLVALAIVADIFGNGRRQRMRVMEWVWPITGRCVGSFAAIGYYRWAARPGSRARVSVSSL